MTYKELREVMKKEKGSRPNERMKVVNHGRFAVMSSNKVDAIIIDSEIAPKIEERKWCIDAGGYPVIRVGGELVRLFDYVLAQVTDEKPKGCYVDHINHDKLDNRLTNLRFVSPLESSLNMPLNSKNTSGYTGVHKTKNGTYRAYITYNKKRMELGYYKTIDEAIRARREAEDRLGFKTRPATIKSLIELEERE